MKMLKTSTLSEKMQTATSDRGVCVAEDNAWYQGCDMAMAYCRLTEQLAAKSGTKIEKEIRCLERFLKHDFLDYCPEGGLNLIDLGTGDGQKMILVIKALNEGGKNAIRYIPVDSNPYISRYAILSILGSGKKIWNKEDAAKLFEPLGRFDFNDILYTDSVCIETLVRLSKLHSSRSEFIVRDEVTIPTAGLEIDFFQNLPEVVSNAKRLNRNGMNVFCMLGNTFGNYLAENRNIFLDTLYDEMEFGELFLLGLSLRPAEESFCSEQIRFLEREHLPGEEFMRLGADHPQAKYHIKYDPDSCYMKYSFVRPDKTIQEIGYSYLFDANEVVNDLNAAHLEVVSCESYPVTVDSGSLPSTRDEPKYLTILARKTRR
ncbi:L-histidine N(alpha)-methyltransferase [Verrucomicrobia bacterium]|nr:L-histidine N(alpha)-methyltransferase [Verrucomicrobiota bacterium]